MIEALAQSVPSITNLPGKVVNHIVSFRASPDQCVCLFHHGKIVHGNNSRAVSFPRNYVQQREGIHF